MVVAIRAHCEFLDPVVHVDTHHLSIGGAVKAGEWQIVAANLHAQAILYILAQPGLVPCSSQIGTADIAPVDLLELIAAHWVVQEIGEIGVQVEPVIEAIHRQGCLAVVVLSRPIEGEGAAGSVAAVGRIKRTKTGDESILNRPLRDVVRGMPVRGRV